MEGFDLPNGPKNFNSALNKIPSSESMVGICGRRNIGSFISTPNTSSKKILAGVFCLNIPVTDNGQISSFNCIQFLQSKYSYDTYTV